MSERFHTITQICHMLAQSSDIDAIIKLIDTLNPQQPYRQIIGVACKYKRFDFLEKFLDSKESVNLISRDILLFRLIKTNNMDAITWFTQKLRKTKYRNTKKVNCLKQLPSDIYSTVVRNAYFTYESHGFYMILTRNCHNDPTCFNLKVLFEEVPMKYIPQDLKRMFIIFESTMELIPLPRDLVLVIKYYI